MISLMKNLDPRATWFFFISFVLRGAVLFIAVMVWSGSFWFGLSPEERTSIPLDFTSWLWIAVALWAVGSFVWAKLTNYFYRYELTDAGFRKESGVIYKRYVTIPYDRIQNVDIYRGIVARLLGLSDLQVQTAGSSAVYGRAGFGMNAEGRLPGLSKEEAEQLRNRLTERIGRPKNQGLLFQIGDTRRLAQRGMMLSVTLHCH